ncbi:hypothetical protein CVT26_000689 [Gymnopilus dilepis]|uniref:Cytochrome P450 n=1 Tax=Gymnopilus dilepis TaxID=231916 RepID=A0A409W757_9AGAR|nr:hypothetical protein CVT26_000689 [Gymnopilus dilepis]
MLEAYNELLPVSGNVLLLVVVILSWMYFFFNSFTYKLKHIPTVGGSSNILLSYISSLRYNFHGQEMIQEGYEKYKGSAFKVPTMTRWLVVISGPQMLDDVRRASDEYMSLDASESEILQSKYTAGKAIHSDPWHANFFRAPLTKHLSNRHEGIVEEVLSAAEDIFRGLKTDGFQVTVHEIAKKIIARGSSHIFVGLPLCRNADYLQLSEKFTMEVFLSSHLINVFPKVFHPILGCLITGKVTKTVKQVENYIRPLVQIHTNQKVQSEETVDNEFGNLVTWMVDEAMASGRPIDLDDLTRRILGTNFVSISSMAAALTDALFNLAAYPEYASPLRQEIESVVGAEGWNKISVAKMVKVDSFIKETQRLGTGGVTGNRQLLKNFTFSNGIFLPAGTYFAFASHSTHRDEAFYSNSTEFQGFRFSDVAPEEVDDPKHQMVSLTPEYLIFGSGRHACPGRFFAAFVLKIAFAYIVLNYDVEFPENGRLPDHWWFQTVCLPDVKAELIFKKRLQMG